MEIPLERDDLGGKWITPGKPRKSLFPTHPNPKLHAVIVHLPILPAGAAAQPLDIFSAFLQAAQLPAHTCADVSLHLHQNNRLAVLRTHCEAIINRLLHITSITLQNTSLPIINDLESYHAENLHARQMSTTDSAIITFIGTHVSYTVHYCLKFRCRPHKPRAHHCNNYLEYGHPTVPHVFHHPDLPGRTSSLHTLVSTLPGTSTSVLPTPTADVSLHGNSTAPNLSGTPYRAGTPLNPNLLHTACQSHLGQSANSGSPTTCGIAGCHQNIDHNIISLHCPSFSTVSQPRPTAPAPSPPALSQHFDQPDTAVAGLVKRIDTLATVVEA
ncbi:hypothetical protein HPB47_011066 [Ixodes persulcatus]|uniref:Uncharacterized protein n=1 Tax=Ixodes persulcatus TaxID=34615 RepID=A0AC60NXD1_IXOPE|nr:hypothetical protein HPB47_011066 [Ixodes persulcatus]